MHRGKHNTNRVKTKQRDAELGTNTANTALDFGSLQNILKSFGWYSSVAWELKVTTSAAVYSSMAAGVESHHSVEERFTSKILFVFGLLYAAILLYLANKIRAYYRLNESVDYPLLSILAAVVLMLVGALFKFVHFWVYSQTGEDVAAVEVFARIWFLAGDFILTVVLVLIARGWGVKQLGDFLSEFEIEFLVGAILLVSRYIWVLVGFFIESDTEHIYHMFDGVVGKLELIASILAYIWFVLTMKLHNSLNQKKFENLKYQLLGYSTLFLLIRPALILSVYLFTRASQHGAALVIYLGSHCIVAGLLAVSFTNKNGVYMKISLSNALELGGNTKAT